MRISYNDYKPYFSFKNDQIDLDTMEGVVIENFVEANNLTTEFVDENFKFGSKDANGTFNGVVGRVI